MLSNPAARASRYRLPRPGDRVQASEPGELLVSNDWTPKLRRLTPASRKPVQPGRRRRFRVGLERDLGVRRDVEGLAAGRDESADLVRLEQRRRAAAEEDRVDALRPGRRCRISPLQRVDVAVLQAGSNRPAVEVAVVADRGAERDVEVEAEHLSIRAGFAEPRCPSPSIAGTSWLDACGAPSDYDPALPPDQPSSRFRPAVRDRGP